jgi:polysaccharide export outer membrane protein
MRISSHSRKAVATLCLVMGAVVSARQVAIKIAPRDQVAISVWNGGVKEDSYSGEFLIDVDNSFEYPTLGRIKAGGLTARELEADLKLRLEKYLVSPQVTIEIKQTTTKKVVINGQVGTPGAMPFSGEMTLFEALTRAGSITDQAGDEAVIHRTPAEGGATKPIRVDLYELFNGQQLTNNLVLQDGDIVIVPKADPVFVTGFVQSQGPVQVKRGTTVRQVLAMAGGLSDRGSPRGIKIQRTVDGKKKDIEVKNIDTDVVKPGDTIVVSARIF